MIMVVLQCGLIQRAGIVPGGPQHLRRDPLVQELVGLTDGVRESTQSWKELLLNLKRRGLSMGPELAIADGALGFWQAVEEVWPQTRGQRCWVHKTANVLNKLPKSQQSKAKRAVQEIWMAETKNYKVLHEHNVMLTIKSEPTPSVE